jgi:ABC-type transport system involved in cytochrome c biogenesis permease component
MRQLAIVLVTLFFTFAPLDANAQENNNMAIGVAAVGAIVGAVALPVVAPVIVAAATASYVAAAGVAMYAPITVSAAVGALTGYWFAGK